MEISFNISQANLIELRKAFQKDLDTAKSVVEDIEDNIARIDRALNPVTRMPIRSESNPFREYTVTKTATYGTNSIYECSCPSFQYERGLDDDGYCKHIRQAKNRGL